MSKAANVFDVQIIYTALQELNQNKNLIYEICNEGLNQARQMLDETQCEEQTSKTMLDISKAVEIAKHGIVIELEARLAAVLAELTAAIPNPIAMSVASAKVGEVESQLGPARLEYEEAVRHREVLEHRYELAVKCLNLAHDRLDTLQMKFETERRSIEVITDRGCARLSMAYQDLTKYISRITPDYMSNINKWFNEKPKENEPVRPNEIRDRLDVSEYIVDAILEYLYATDLGFHTNVDNYCNEMKVGNQSSAELKIKKNMVGRLCEELVIRSFKPISSKIITQSRESLPDGSYTKVDMIVYGLTNPLILGKGEGLGAREGGSLAVEVKSGHSSYLYSQLNHLLSQAIGHSRYDISCVVCTRDIHNLSQKKEIELREKLRDAGSPIIGMLPYKDELDDRCINFVKGKLKDV